jgi:CrcB protein
MQDNISSGSAASHPNERHPGSQARRPAWWRAFWDKTGSYVAVALGSIIGAVARFLVSVLFVSQFGNGFPWATLFVNVTGSMMIGFYAALTGPDGRLMVSPRQRQFVMVGICGGYTTFSAFSLETVTLLQRGNPGGAAANVALSLLLCLVAVWAGHKVAESANI